MPLNFKLDDQEFTLSNECLFAVADTLERTKVKERGRMLCRDFVKKADGKMELVGEIMPGREHIGGRGSITERNCPGAVGVGHFHTHPTGSSDPSWWDAYSIIANSYHAARTWLGCRGATEDQMVQCNTVKRLPTKTELQELRARHRRMKYTRAEADPEIRKHLTEPYKLPAKQIPNFIFEVPEYPEYLVECDRQHSLVDLKDMAREASLSLSGDKKELCRKLIEAGILPPVPVTPISTLSGKLDKEPVPV